MGLEVIGQITNGVAQMEAGKYTRTVMQINARNDAADTQQEIDRLRTTARLAMGRQAAGFAGSGFQSDGSALDALRESAIESELEIGQTRRRGITRQNALRSQGEIAYATGYNASVQQYFGAAKTAVEAIANYAGGGGGGA